MKTTTWGMAIYLAVIFSAASLPANPIHVAPAAAGGNDANNGLSWASPKLTPQAGITAAGSGGEVIISNGTYVLSSTISITSPVVLKSLENDPATVIIDGAASVRCLSVGTGANGTAVSGITFTNGYSSSGGGIQVSGTGHANTLISNVVVTACVSTGPGGGVDLRSGWLTDSLITGNSAANYGGGVYNISGVIRVERCTIESNSSGTALDGGAGLWLQSSATNHIIDSVFRNNTGPAALLLYASAVALIEGCDFIENSGRAISGIVPVVSNCTFIANKGGGLSLSGASYVVDCTFVSNSVTGNGGAIVMNNAAQVVDRCIITHNFASASGGGIHMTAGTVRNSVIAGNEVGSSGWGGGIRAITSTKALIENCTIVGNRAPQSNAGGGIMSQNATGMALTNSIVLFNDSGGTATNYRIFTANSLQFGYSCTMPAPTGTADTGNNKAENPLFVDAGSGYGTNYVMGDLTLQKTSTVKDNGTNLSWMTLASTDLAGNPRLAFGIVDMGAYEFPQGPGGSVFLFR